MELDGLPRTVMPLRVVTLTSGSDLLTRISQAQVHSDLIVVKLPPIVQGYCIHPVNSAIVCCDIDL